MKTYRIDDDRSLWELARDIVAQRRKRKMSDEKQKGIGTSPSDPDNELQARVIAHYKAGEKIMRFFVFGHLRPEQRVESRKWATLAVEACDALPPSAERAAGLRKLMEAKDCFVRASLPEPV